jgi:hypothetical protein
MTSDVPLACACRSVLGIARDVAPETGNRVVCMCDDCQAYAHHLGAGPILDANGGTDIFQLTPSQITITHGSEHLRLLRLTPKGLLRWYAGCCNTPIANTLTSPRMPFVGMPHTFMDHESAGRTRDEVLGPPVAWVHARWGKGELPDRAHPRFPIGLLVRTLRLLLGAWLAEKHRPSPFFDARTGAPVVDPTVLTAEQREALRAQVEGP